MIVSPVLEIENALTGPDVPTVFGCVDNPFVKAAEVVYPLFQCLPSF
jgi:hypothetical protein